MCSLFPEMFQENSFSTRWKSNGELTKYRKQITLFAHFFRIHEWHFFWNVSHLDENIRTIKRLESLNIGNVLYIWEYGNLRPASAILLTGLTCFFRTNFTHPCRVSWLPPSLCLNHFFVLKVFSKSAPTKIHWSVSILALRTPSAKPLVDHKYKLT